MIAGAKPVTNQATDAARAASVAFFMKKKSLLALYALPKISESVPKADIRRTLVLSGNQFAFLFFQDKSKNIVLRSFQVIAESSEAQIIELHSSVRERQNIEVAF